MRNGISSDFKTNLAQGRLIRIFVFFWYYIRKFIAYHPCLIMNHLLTVQKQLKFIIAPFKFSLIHNRRHGLNFYIVWGQPLTALHVVSHFGGNFFCLTNPPSAPSLHRLTPQKWWQSFSSFFFSRPQRKTPSGRPKPQIQHPPNPVSKKLTTLSHPEAKSGDVAVALEPGHRVAVTFHVVMRWVGLGRSWKMQNFQNLFERKLKK